jgi:hypothetical protein
MRRLVAALFMVLAISGCGFSEYREKEKALSKSAIESVQKSESVVKGTNTLNILALTLKLIESSGKYVKVDGWSCDKNIKDDCYDVWFSVAINEIDQKYHWIIKGNELIPANDLAQTVTIRQMITL